MQVWNVTSSCLRAAFFYFSSSFFFVSFLLNIIFLYFPVLGAPKSSLTAWIKDFRGRHWALLAGALCGLGNGFQFMVRIHHRLPVPCALVRM